MKTYYVVTTPNHDIVEYEKAKDAIEAFRILHNHGFNPQKVLRISKHRVLDVTPQI